jgi:rhodanese-related sulfurtransferase
MIAAAAMSFSSVSVISNALRFTLREQRNEFVNDVWTWAVPLVLLVAWLALTQLGKISAAKARALVATGAELIDVRTKAEYASGHLAGARNVPLDQLPAQAKSLAAGRKPLVVYCQSGVRSGRAKRLLRAAGATEVYDLGGMSRWG